VVKLLSTLILILAIVLFPPAVLAFVSQDAVPGDHTYPVKRKLEEVVLAAASVNPTTRALFSVGLTDRRFKESTTLLGEGKNADATLSELVTQTTTAAAQINQVSDQGQKQKLEDNLQTDVKKYIVTLAQTQDAQETLPTQLSTPTSTPVSAAPSLEPSEKPSSAPSSSRPTVTPSPVMPPPFRPSPRPSVTPTPQPSQTVNSIPSPSTQPDTTDTQKICDDARAGLGSLNKTIKDLCGIINPSEKPNTEVAPKLEQTQTNNAQPARPLEKLEPSKNTSGHSDDGKTPVPNNQRH
jgi:hypothetical protein